MHPKIARGWIHHWALTAADRSGCAAYFEQAGIDFPCDNLLSCDTSSMGKPDPRIVQTLVEQVERRYTTSALVCSGAHVGHERGQKGRVGLLLYASVTWSLS